MTIGVQAGRQKGARGKMFHVHLPSGRNGLKEEL